MFKKFENCDHLGRSIGQFVLINLKLIETISPVGHWVRPESGGGPEVWQPILNCVFIMQGNNSQQVIANFDELVAILESLNSLYE
jgi:hypothetical protein